MPGSWRLHCPSVCSSRSGTRGEGEHERRCIRRLGAAPHRDDERRRRGRARVRRTVPAREMGVVPLERKEVRAMTLPIAEEEIDKLVRAANDEWEAFGFGYLSFG